VGQSKHHTKFNSLYELYTSLVVYDWLETSHADLYANITKWGVSYKPSKPAIRWRGMISELQEFKTRAIALALL